MVTIDAAGCQTAIVQALRAAGADYVLAVKRNQSRLHAEVAAAFADAERGAFTPEAQDYGQTFKRNGGRTERRTWPCGRQRAVRYYISSRPVDAEALLALVRGHWGIENGLHRTLDVQFRKDDCRLRRGHGPAVMGILRRAALNMVHTLQYNFSANVSIGLLQDKIGCHPRILAAALP